MNDHPAKSKHEREHAAMLEEALSRPSIRQVMEVYRNWQKADWGMEPYRLAAKQYETVTTADHAKR